MLDFLLVRRVTRGSLRLALSLAIGANAAEILGQCGADSAAAFSVQVSPLNLGKAEFTNDLRFRRAMYGVNG